MSNSHIKHQFKIGYISLQSSPSMVYFFTHETHKNPHALKMFESHPFETGLIRFGRKNTRSHKSFAVKIDYDQSRIWFFISLSLYLSFYSLFCLLYNSWCSIRGEDAILRVLRTDKIWIRNWHLFVAGYSSRWIDFFKVIHSANVFFCVCCRWNGEEKISLNEEQIWNVFFVILYPHCTRLNDLFWYWKILTSTGGFWIKLCEIIISMIAKKSLQLHTYWTFSISLEGFSQYIYRVSNIYVHSSGNLDIYKYMKIDSSSACIISESQRNKMQWANILDQFIVLNATWFAPTYTTLSLLYYYNIFENVIFIHTHSLHIIHPHCQCIV